MLYFKNSELAYTYHVSVKTISNWIEAAKQDKLGLTLYQRDGRSHITNTTQNIALIEQLVERGKKYRPHRALKVVTPKPEFYKLYNQSQIYDIVSSIENRHEIPREYNYFDKGAVSWDNYTQRLARETTPNTLNATKFLLVQNEKYLDSLLSKYKKINIVDVGVGNALPVKDFLQHFLDEGKLGRYIAIDISKEMLQIARKNVKKWFNGAVQFEDHRCDINYEKFSDVLAQEYMSSKSSETANLILSFGGTISNLRKPAAAFRILHDSMGINDFLLHAQKLDTESSRRYFDFNLNPNSSSLAPNHRLIFDLLNIDPSFYDVEMGFDSEKKERYIRVRLKIALTLKFDFEAGQRVLELDKGDTILLWRAWQKSALDVTKELDESEFYPLQSSQTDDQEYILTISRIKRN
ncbi:MAG TPA: L-histidine N(alpha)-methyltransferase [Candidatus Saccharimonadales bacterium]|nr:L-histidine N(alpha)-methyltransferase [Candidatus Saccharimonadales bacterium]